MAKAQRKSTKKKTVAKGKGGKPGGQRRLGRRLAKEKRLAAARECTEFVERELERLGLFMRSNADTVHLDRCKAKAEQLGIDWDSYPVEEPRVPTGDRYRAFRRTLMMAEEWEFELAMTVRPEHHVQLRGRDSFVVINELLADDDPPPEGHWHWLCRMYDGEVERVARERGEKFDEILQWAGLNGFDEDSLSEAVQERERQGREELRSELKALESFRNKCKQRRSDFDHERLMREASSVSPRLHFYLHSLEFPGCLEEPPNTKVAKERVLEALKRPLADVRRMIGNADSAAERERDAIKTTYCDLERKLRGEGHDPRNAFSYSGFIPPLPYVRGVLRPPGPGVCFWWEDPAAWEKYLDLHGGLAAHDDFPSSEFWHSVEGAGDLLGSAARWWSSTIPSEGDVEWEHLESDPYWGYYWQICESILKNPENRFTAFGHKKRLEYRLRMLASVDYTRGWVVATLAKQWWDTRPKRRRRKTKSLRPYLAEDAIRFIDEHKLPLNRDTYDKYVASLKKRGKIQGEDGHVWTTDMPAPTYDAWRKWYTKP